MKTVIMQFILIALINTSDQLLQGICTISLRLIRYTHIALTAPKSLEYQPKTFQVSCQGSGGYVLSLS